MRLMATAAVLALAMAASASAETRNLRGFNSIGASDQMRVEISVGGDYAVEVTGADADRVRTRVEDGALLIDQRNRPWFGSRHLNAVVRVSVPELESIAAARGVEVSARGVESERFDIAAAMGAEVRVSGTCGVLDATAAMGASIRADELQCRVADVSAAMGGSARVYASETYEGSASMGGSIDISGDGASRGRSTAMGGSIND
ncbi:MAG: DUF2807 domain-containing protein [Caulobacterales bacterium]|nr:DUF2807 domain-containing protein [Caulobacterales bacterium]